MFSAGMLLARVMSKANDYDDSAVQVRLGPGHVPAHLGEPSRAPDAGRAHRSGPATRAFRYPARRPGGAGAERGDDAERAGGVREGAAAVNHPGYRRFGRTRPDPADAAPKR